MSSDKHASIDKASRRDFLKVSVAGAAVVGAATSLNLARSAHGASRTGSAAKTSAVLTKHG